MERVDPKFALGMKTRNKKEKKKKKCCLRGPGLSPGLVATAAQAPGQPAAAGRSFRAERCAMARASSRRAARAPDGSRCRRGSRGPRFSPCIPAPAATPRLGLGGPRRRSLSHPGAIPRARFPRRIRAATGQLLQLPQGHVPVAPGDAVDAHFNLGAQRAGGQLVVRAELAHAGLDLELEVLDQRVALACCQQPLPGAGGWRGCCWVCGGVSRGSGGAGAALVGIEVYVALG